MSLFLSHTFYFGQPSAEISLKLLINLIFTRWGADKFPKETPLVFYHSGQPILPPVEMLDGLRLVLKSMVSHIEKNFPQKVLKFWRLQSPRHFYGGEWNQNGSCLFDDPLEETQV